MATLQDLARIIGELPEVTEGERHGHPTWSVRGKSIAWLRPFSKADLKRFGDQTPPAQPILAVNTADLHEKEGVLAAGIDGVFTIEHFNNYPAVLIELDVIASGDLRDLLVDAWLAAAPPDLAEAFDG
ncbi:MmcQ/YjbR family DNA-binding protein [Nocardioides sp. NPDC051685]|uniref:MmcQ/YjbR family DNA-binding protein n=1 Tax=Nocardioides sp. NPDC051685 TaxID=3364334 RepID=UPI0037B33935